MNLSAPWESVVPTLDGAVLTTLARLNEPVTGRQVHQLAGIGSEAGIRNVLNRLVHQGIVRASPAGSAWLYAVNREHVSWRTVEDLANIRGRFLSLLRSRVDEWKVPARSAALFGSAARQDGDADSDIDLLVIRADRVDQDDPSWLEQVSQLKLDIIAWTGNDAQIYELDGAGLAHHIAAQERIVDEWRKDAIPIAGVDLRNLLRELGYNARARRVR
jgi:predicted nucleotidyltransferase